MWMTEDNIVEVPFDNAHLFETILSPDNLNKAYKAVVRNKGCGGIDNMSCEQLLPWLLANKDDLIRTLMDGTYRPNPVRRVEIPKDNGKKRLLGIPTVVDRMVQQAINQVLTPIYEPEFSNRSFGFRPRRGCLVALREVQKTVDEGYRYVIDLDLERFFDTVSHSKRFIYPRREVSRLLLLCTQRQMPAYGTSQIQGKDEVTSERTDRPEQRMGICQEKAESERVHSRMGGILSSCQYETSLSGNR